MIFQKYHFLFTGILILLVVIFGGLYVRESYRNVDIASESLTKNESANTPSVVVEVSQVVNAEDARKTSAAPRAPLKKVDNSSALLGKSALELSLPTGFANSEPFKLQDLVGKNVIVLSFQNYSSINSVRALPYLNNWHQKYRNSGLSVITVHTPRFAFDRTKDFVDKMAFTHRVIHPIVLDSQFANAKAWESREWPTTFLVDIHGKVVSVFRGEGSYDTIDARIQQLLSERAKKLSVSEIPFTPFETPGGVIRVEHPMVQSPETFFGAVLNSRLSNGIAHRMGIQDMKPISTVLLNKLYLSGSWEFTGDFARSSIEQCAITYRYNAKNVYATLGSSKTTKVYITLDGGPLGARAGADVREEKGQSYIFVTEERIYDIVKGDTYGEHTLVFTPETPGLEAYVLMFG